MEFPQRGILLYFRLVKAYQHLHHRAHMTHRVRLMGQALYLQQLPMFRRGSLFVLEHKTSFRAQSATCCTIYGNIRVVHMNAHHRAMHNHVCPEMLGYLQFEHEENELSAISHLKSEIGLCLQELRMDRDVHAILPATSTPTLQHSLGTRLRTCLLLVF